MACVTECVMSSIEMSSMYTEHLAGNCREKEGDEERWNRFFRLHRILGAGEGGTQCLVRAMLTRGSPSVCVWHHGLLWKESVAAASRLCSPSATLWLHRPSTVWAGRFTQALTAWDTPVSTLIVSPFIHITHAAEVENYCQHWRQSCDFTLSACM